MCEVQVVQMPPYVEWHCTEREHSGPKKCTHIRLGRRRDIDRCSDMDQARQTIVGSTAIIEGQTNAAEERRVRRRRVRVGNVTDVILVICV